MLEIPAVAKSASGADMYLLPASTGLVRSVVWSALFPVYLSSFRMYPLPFIVGYQSKMICVLYVFITMKRLMGATAAPRAALGSRDSRSGMASVAPRAPSRNIRRDRAWYFTARQPFSGGSWVAGR